jgi:CBS domain-containing protein
MNVKDFMTPHPLVCTEDTDLAAAARLMWDGDCGVLPVVDRGERVIGMITDRDIAMAMFMRNKPECNVTVGEVVSGPVHRCRPDDKLETPMAIMREYQVRRLPVTDREGRLEGILSLNDLVLKAGETPAAVPASEILATLRAVSRHRATPAPV